MKRRVLIVAGWYLPGHKSGGPVRSLSNLIDATNHEFSFCVVTRDRDIGDPLPYEGISSDAWNRVAGALVRYVSPGLRGWLQIARVIRNGHFDLLYLNTFFSVKLSLLPLLMCLARNKAVLLAPRGQFSRGALAFKSAKKTMFTRLYRAMGLPKRVTWQATHACERDDIHAVFGSSVDVVVAENISSRIFADVIPPKSSDRIRLVFLSRISPKKNLDFALRVLSGVSQPVSFDIYGPKEDDEYWSDCQALIRRLPHHVSASIEGPLSPAVVVDVLKGYDAFFLPTRGENFGHVIAEAFCAGLPVLISDQTPWRNLEEQGIGWDIPLSEPHRFAACIDELNRIGVDRHLQMRERIRSWARDRFGGNQARSDSVAMLEYACKSRGD